MVNPCIAPISNNHAFIFPPLPQATVLRAAASCSEYHEQTSYHLPFLALSLILRPPFVHSCTRISTPKPKRHFHQARPERINPKPTGPGAQGESTGTPILKFQFCYPKSSRQNRCWDSPSNGFSKIDATFSRRSSITQTIFPSWASTRQFPSKLRKRGLGMEETLSLHAIGVSISIKNTNRFELATARIERCRTRKNFYKSIAGTHQLSA